MAAVLIASRNSVIATIWRTIDVEKRRSIETPGR